ncbi:aldo/keto reductase [Actinacidiphila rubida]|uniref:Predicted oxidoreductase n=1 Tax=Actinacidiphila rubida TaxID=310780 RepID=A0A1H8MCT2_9ACTN|nr:aldo/keto reductase [Actinacidiphila rubida]SEO15165.1 Predicted oxidoreductase [Actinacidiphila rubida]
MTRLLGRSGIEVSALGMGCWAIGGPYGNGSTEQFGWGEVDDAESTRALHRAFDLGVTFYDTASSYGAGHSEKVLGAAFRDRRDQVVIASKWGGTFDEETRETGASDPSPAFLRSCLEGSLRRLGTDYVDLYQLHINDLPLEQALDLVGTLEELVAAGTLRAYGWSTDDPARAEAFAAQAPHCTAIQHDQSVLHDNPAMIAVCEASGQASINRGPLAMGLLSGKYHDHRQVADNDVRRMGYGWMTYFRDGTASPEYLAAIDGIRDVLTGGGRTLAQGALAWLWARSATTVPIPGFRTLAQVEENAGALAHGPLTADEFGQVEKLLAAAR